MKLEICDVSKQYKDKCAVDHASLTLTPGVWGLLGANGAGKTTLMRMIAGIMKPTGGEIRYDGIEIGTMGEKYRDIFGYLPQEFGFYPGFSVQDYLEYMAALKGIGKRETKEKIQELLELVSLTDVRKKKISKLSGGMKRRVGIAQALLNEPKVLILDDSTSAVDTATEAKIRSGLAEKLPDMTKIIIAQRISSVRHADQIIIMDRGHVEAIGTHESLLRDNQIYQEIYASQKEGADL